MQLARRAFASLKSCSTKPGFMLFDSLKDIAPKPHSLAPPSLFPQPIPPTAALKSARSAWQARNAVLQFCNQMPMSLGLHSRPDLFRHSVPEMLCHNYQEEARKDEEAQGKEETKSAEIQVREE